MVWKDIKYVLLKTIVVLILVFVVAGFPGCGGVLTAPSGDIRSPNHPDRYRENMDCEWHIQLPIGERIRLTFLSFSLEQSSGCYFDYVSVSISIAILILIYLLTYLLTYSMEQSPSGEEESFDMKHKSSSGYTGWANESEACWEPLVASIVTVCSTQSIFYCGSVRLLAAEWTAV